LLPNNFKLFGFLIFWYWGKWWRLFQKGVVRSKVDLYVFSTTQLCAIHFIMLVLNAVFLFMWWFIFIDIFFLFAVIFFLSLGPGWLNELGSWITYQLIQAYHQYGVGSRPAL
jgi:hypothetical protein